MSLKSQPSSSPPEAPDSIAGAAFDADPNGPLGRDVLAATLSAVRRKQQSRAATTVLVVTTVTLGALGLLIPKLETRKNTAIVDASVDYLAQPIETPPAAESTIKVFHSSPTSVIKIFSSADSPAFVETIDDETLLGLISEDATSNGGGILVTATGRKMVFISDPLLP